MYILKLFLNDSSVRSKELKLSKESKVFTVLPLPFPAFLFLFRRSLLDHLVPDEEALEVTDPLKSRGQVVGGNAEVALRVRKLLLQISQPRSQLHLRPETSGMDVRPIDGERRGAKMDNLCGKSLFNF